MTPHGRKIRLGQSAGGELYFGENQKNNDQRHSAMTRRGKGQEEEVQQVQQQERLHQAGNNVSRSGTMGRVPSILPSRRYTTATTIKNNNQEKELKVFASAPPTADHVSVVCGLIAGVTQAGVFNGYDRALYLSVVNRRKFLSKENFVRPYQGFLQSIGHRSLSGGLYFPLEQAFLGLVTSDKNNINQYENENDGSAKISNNTIAFQNFCAGMAAGVANALILNPFAAVKYKTWGRPENVGMINEAIYMFKRNGIRPFCNGMLPTMIRDLTFGGTYTLIRFEIQHHFQLQPWIANMIAAALATVASGPFNLARNVQFATHTKQKAETISQVLYTLGNEIHAQPTLWQKWSHLQNRLRLGWGTARVAVGMSFGHTLYDKLQLLYHEYIIQHQ